MGDRPQEGAPHRSRGEHQELVADPAAEVSSAFSARSTPITSALRSRSGAQSGGIGGADAVGDVSSPRHLVDQGYERVFLRAVDEQCLVRPPQGRGKIADQGRPGEPGSYHHHAGPRRTPSPQVTRYSAPAALACDSGEAGAASGFRSWSRPPFFGRGRRRKSISGCGGLFRVTLYKAATERRLHGPTPRGRRH
jgi:hypothetical protein